MKNLDHDIPINVIVLEDFESDKKDLIDGYIEILKTCRKKSEFYALFEMVYEEIREITLREILTKSIQHQAKVLEDAKRK